MGSATKNFLLVTFAVLISLFLAWTYLRMRGLSQPVVTVMEKHPFMNGWQTRPLVVVAYGGDARHAPPQSRPAYDLADALHPSVAFWASVQTTADGVLVALPDPNLSLTTDGQGWIKDTRFDDLAKLDFGYRYEDEFGKNSFRGQGLRVLTVKELLTSYPRRQMILSFNRHSPELVERVTRLMEETQAADRVLFQSPEDGFLRELREKNPRWLFGTAKAQVTRMIMMASIGLAPSAKLLGDVFVHDTVNSMRRKVDRSGSKIGANNYEELRDSLIDDLKRRKMRLVVGPIDDAEKAERQAHRGVDAILTRDPRALAEKLLR